MTEQLIGFEVQPDRLTFHLLDDRAGDVPVLVTTQRALTVHQGDVDALEGWLAEDEAGDPALDRLLTEFQDAYVEFMQQAEGLLGHVKRLYSVQHEGKTDDRPGPWDNPKHAGRT